MLIACCPDMTSALKAADTDWARATNLRTSVVLMAYMTTNSTKRRVIRSEYVSSQRSSLS